MFDGIPQALSKSNKPGINPAATLCISVTTAIAFIGVISIIILPANPPEGSHIDFIAP